MDGGMTGRAEHRQETCAPMPAKSMEFASERRTHRRSHGEQRDHGAAGIDRRREPGLSFTQDARTGRAYGKCRLDRRAVDNLFSTRSAIEVLLAQQAAQRCTRTDLARLEALQAEFAQRVATHAHAEVLAADQRFHVALYAISDNTDAAWMVARSWLFSNLLWRRVRFAPERYAGMVSDHRHILTAMRENDVEAVGVLMGAHVLKAKYELFQRLFPTAQNDDG